MSLTTFHLASVPPFRIGIGGSDLGPVMAYETLRHKREQRTAMQKELTNPCDRNS
jgi:hypothetical protein